MADRVLRGMKIGANSLENDEGVELAPRLNVQYDCPNGHVIRLPFAAGADVPAVWTCRLCGAEALLLDATRPEPKPTRHVRTHWDMLLERRTIPELEELLAERLDLLRSGVLRGRKSA
jgi:hypothetical protein